MKKQVQKGFTLIELMIVIAIIGIIAAVAIPQYSSYTTKSKNNSCLAEASGVAKSIAAAVQTSDTSVLPTYTASACTSVTGYTNGALPTADYTFASPGGATVTCVLTSGKCSL